MTEAKSPRRFKVVQGGASESETVSEHKSVVVVSDIVHFDIPALLGEVYAKADKTSVNTSLPYKKAGEVSVGMLDDVESDIFCQMHLINTAVEELGKKTMGSVIIEIGKSIQEGTDKQFQGKTSQFIDNMFTDEEKTLHFKRQQAFDMLKSMLYWHLKNKYKLHGWTIGIRKNFELVRVSKMSLSPNVIAKSLSVSKPSEDDGD